jgi:hypothetical protein
MKCSCEIRVDDDDAVRDVIALFEKVKHVTVEVVVSLTNRPNYDAWFKDNRFELVDRVSEFTRIWCRYRRVPR